MNNSLIFRKWWLVLGYVWVLVVITMSLLPNPPDTQSVFLGDKLVHGVTYLLLMVWFCQSYSSNSYRIVGIYLFALGVMIEFAQWGTGYRFLELADIIANLLGILVGWFLLKVWLANLFAGIERILINR